VFARQINHRSIDRPARGLGTREVAYRYRITRGEGLLETLIEEFIEVPLLLFSLRS
jgi:hypothetical protein